MEKHFEIWKITKTTGCVFEDGSDTRKTDIEFVLINSDNEESFHESMAEEYGSQDYSYQVSCAKVCSLWDEELEELKQFFKNLKED